MTIEQKLRRARPRLSEVAPLTNAIVLSFIVGNAIIGIGLWLMPPPMFCGCHLAVVNNIFSFKFYGALFGLLSLALLYGWAINDWRWLRRALLAGVLLKALWTFALIFALNTAANLSILGTWLTLTAIQIAAYVYFVPVPGANNDGKQ